MTAEPPAPVPEPDHEPESVFRLSFKDREMVMALRRLANARSQLTQVEEQMAAQAPAWKPDDVARVEQYQAEIDKLTPKAQGRFGGAAARTQLGEVEMQLRLALDRLGVASVDELRARRSGDTSVAVDAGFLDFARRELAAAEEAYRQVLELPDEVDVEVDDEGYERYDGPDGPQ